MATYGNTYEGTATTDSGDTKTIAADAAKQTAGTAKEQAAEVASTAKAKTGEVAGTAKEQGLQVISEVKTQAADLTGQLRTQASEQAIQQRDRAASTLRSFSEELRGMADNGQNGMASSAASQLASRTQSLADYLERKEPSEVIDDVRDIARRRPGAFLLGAAVTGLVAGRLLKGAKEAGSSSNSAQPTSDYTDADSLALPAYGTASTYGTQPQGDPLSYASDPLTAPISEVTHGHEAVGERVPTTGPLSTGNEPFGSSRPTGGSYS